MTSEKSDLVISGSVGLHKYKEDAREARTIPLIPYKLKHIELLELCKLIWHFRVHSLEKNW